MRESTSQVLSRTTGAAEYDGSATDGGARYQADQHLRALLRYTGGFYTVAIAQGMRAADTANAIAHIEKAGKALHGLVHAWSTVAAKRDQQGSSIATADAFKPSSAHQPSMSDFNDFVSWANDQGYDTAHAHDGGKWVCLNPMTADLWKTWQAAQAKSVDAVVTTRAASVQQAQTKPELPTVDMRFLKQVVGVAIAGLFEHYKNDVERAFDTATLREVAAATSSLVDQRVEDIYKRAWEMLSITPPRSATPSDHNQIAVELVRIADIIRDCGRYVDATGIGQRTLRITAEMLTAFPPTAQPGPVQELLGCILQEIDYNHHQPAAWVDAQVRGEMAKAVHAAIRRAVPSLGPWSAFDADEVQAMADALTPFACRQPAAPASTDKLTVTLKDDWRTDDFGRPIIYDTREVDEVTGALTRDEGEDDSLTVLNSMVAYVNNVWPGKTAMEVLIEYEKAMLAAAPAQLVVENSVKKGQKLAETRVDAGVQGCGQTAAPDRSGCSAGTDDECTNKDCARACPSLAAAAQPEALEVQWPKARDVGRYGDMSPTAHLRVGLDSDSDVYVSVWVEEGGASVEFCTPGAGGGCSPATRTALIALMLAMEQDNTKRPDKDWWAKRLGKTQTVQERGGA